MNVHLRNQTPPMPAWDHLPEISVCSPKLFEEFATFLMYEYVSEKGKNKGDFLATDSVVNTVFILLDLAKDKYKNSTNQNTKTFISCLDQGATSSTAQWLKSLKKHIKHELFSCAVRNGTKIDNSETPVYSLHTRQLNEALSLEGSPEAVVRKLGITSVQRTAGRSSEIAFLTFDSLRWDPHFELVFIEVPQPKTHKVKVIAFAAGAHRHNDWFVDFADFLMLASDVRVYDPDEAPWFFPELQKTNSPGSKIGSWIKALLPLADGGSGVKKYERFVVHGLPKDATAGGIRPGAINELAEFMPAEYIVQLTGHDLKSISALWEYIDARYALLLPACTVQAGWPALPWGQHGKGPTPPSLTALKVVLSGSAMDDRLENLIDDIFRIHSATPPRFHRAQVKHAMLVLAIVQMLARI